MPRRPLLLAAAVLRCVAVRFGLATVLGPALFAGTTAAPWLPDRGDGTFQNPVLFADYSDPDAIRVGDDYYLVASSFAVAPALPLLHSRDLVNWTLVNHALPRQVPPEFFAKPRHGQGVWAPALRYHAGKFWIFYPDPDFGLYVVTAEDPRGRWSGPRLVKAGKGLIDPCPFWDDDGRLYLVHGWARSRAGIANLLSLHELSPDATRLLDAGQHLRPGPDGGQLDLGDVVIDANLLPGWNTLEGPKLYKRHGWYYIFAPAGGVKTGYQAVFRSRSIRGPYEGRIVLDQGATPINGPHQGAWVDTPGGEDWFLHFQDRDAFGRVVHLQPLVWRDDWPVIGADPDGDGKGEPVLVFRKPDTGAAQPVTAPATSDEFATPALGLQWQWNANPQPAWADLAARPGFLRLACIPAPATRNDGSPAPGSLYDAPNFLLQKFPGPAFVATTSLDFAPSAEGDTAGLAVFGYNYVVLGLRRTGGETRLVLRVNLGANQPGVEERELVRLPAPAGSVCLRVAVDAQALCRFSYSTDNRTFVAVGEPLQATVDRWIGAKVGVIATAAPGALRPGHADFDWFHLTASSP